MTFCEIQAGLTKCYLKHKCLIYVFPRAVTMLNFERFDAGNVEKPKPTHTDPHTDNHALESGSSMDPTPSKRTPVEVQSKRAHIVNVLKISVTQVRPLSPVCGQTP